MTFSNFPVTVREGERFTLFLLYIVIAEKVIWYQEFVSY